MADRTVVTRLVLDLAGYTPQTMEASKSTSALATAQKETATAARDAAIAQREASAVAKDAAAQASVAAQAQATAYREASAAATEASAAQVAAAEATGEAERADAEAAAQAAAVRLDAAKEALAAATTQAEADAQATAAAKAGATEAARYAQTQRDVATAAKESAAVESAAAKEAAAASAERSKAYKDGGTAATTAALVTGAAIGLMEKAAGDYQSTTEHFVTDAGESQKNLGTVQAGILKTAVDTGTGATALTDAMYHIESAGYHGANGLNALTTAAEGAKVGNADLGVVAKTLTGTMNSYNMSIDQSVPMMNQLIASVGAGDMKMNDLASSLGNVTPNAAAARISFAQVGGAIATMTSQNMTADRATQDLNNTIINLEKPNGVAIQQMQQMGLSSNDVSQQLGSRGLTGTLQLLTTAILSHTQNGEVFIDTLKQSQNAASDANVMLQQLPPSIQGISKELLNGTISAAEYKKATSNLDAPNQHLAAQFDQLVKNSGSFNTLLSKGGPAAETYTAALSNMLGGTTGLGTALMLTGGRMPTFEANVATVQAAADKGGTSVDNWAVIQGTFNQKIDVAKASLGVLAIAIGTTLLPVVSDMAKWITDIIKPIAEWVDKNQALTAVVLGSATALTALVLAINLAVKAGQQVKNAFDAVKTAVDFVTKSSKEAATETAALGTANATAAKETEAMATASGAAAVKAEAMATASSTAASETEAAAVSTGGWAGKLGASIPILGAATLGAQALGGWINKLADSQNKNVGSTDQWTTSLLSGTTSANMFGMSAQQAQKEVDSLGGKANSAISPVAAIGVELAKSGQMMGDGAAVVKNYDGALAALVGGGHADRAATLMAQIASATDAQGKALVDTQKDFPQYWAAVAQGTASQALSTGATNDATAALASNSSALGANADATAAAAGATAAATPVVSGAASQQLQTAAAVRSLAEAQAAATDKTLVGIDATKDAIAAHKLGVAALQAVSGAEGDTASAAATLDTSMTDEITAMKDASAKASNLKDALDALNGVHIAASKAAVDEQQKVADLTKALDTNGKTLDITTEAGRKNVTAIDDMASAANAHAQAVASESGSIDAGNKALDASRAQFDAVLKSAGYSTTQIDTFNKTLLNTPKLTQVVLSVSADTTSAAASLQALENKYNGTGIVFGGGPSGKRIVPGMYTGGLITGAGTGTSDSNMIAASAGEYMVRASVVQQPGMLATLNELNFGSGTTSVVKPQVPLRALPTSAAGSSGSGPGSALHIENYFENGAPPQQVAAELGWLAKNRGSSW